MNQNSENEAPKPQIDPTAQVSSADSKAAAAVAVDNEAEAHGRGEGVGQAMEVEGKSQSQIVRERFFRHKGALFGMTTLALVALLSFTSMGIGDIPGWWRYQDAMASNDVINGGKPTWTWAGPGLHPFGQDQLGRDNFAMVMKGVQSSLLVMLIMSAIAMCIGVTIGSLAGYYRGKVDMILMRFTDMVITLPTIVIGAVLGKLISSVPTKMRLSAETMLNINKAMPLLLAVALGCILWTGLARLTRSEFLSLREREFVDSARVAGASNRRIILKHMLPNALGVVIVNATLLMASSVILETSLSYLGFGIQEPSVSLGMLISTYQTAFSTRPWLFWWPGLFIILVALSVNFIGDGLRDAFDPRSKRIPSRKQMESAIKRVSPSETIQAAGDGVSATSQEGAK